MAADAPINRSTECLNDSAKMLTLIYEDSARGHRLSYVRRIVRHASISGHVRVLVEESGIGAPELENLPATAEILPLGPEQLGLRPRALAHLAAVHGASRVIVPDGDALALQLGTARRWKSSATLVLLIMREPRPDRFRLGSRAWWRVTLKRILLRRTASLPRVKLFTLRAYGDDEPTPFRIVRDPYELNPHNDLVHFRREHGIDDGVIWFAVLGAITARKSLAIVATALSVAANSGPSVGLVIAGLQSSDVVDEIRVVRALAASGRLRLLEFDERLAERDLDSFVAVADCIVLAHQNEGPSGILGKAALAGRPVIAAGALSLRRDVASVYAQGAWWVPLNEGSLTAVFARFLEAEPSEVEVFEHVIGGDEDVSRLADWNGPSGHA